MGEPAQHSRVALAYRARDSALHRAGAGGKLFAALLVSGGALACDDAAALSALVALIGVGYAVARLDLRDLWLDARWLAAQGCIVIALTVALRGAAAWSQGLRAALQILLFFLPMALALRTTPSSQILSAVERALPERIAFATAAGARFLPFFVREATELVAAQRLRGALLAPHQLWRPAAWRDWLDCVALPLVVRAIEAAEEAATAAEIRGLARRENGT